jgi:hypothetical protein
VNLKTVGLAAVLPLALLPLASRAQTTTAPGNAAPQRLRTTFTSPLKIVGSSGSFTVTPRNSSTAWSCAEGQSTEIDAGSPPKVVYTLSADGNVLVANANGGALKVDIAKGQYATAASADAVDSAPMKDFATLGSGAPTLFGTAPKALSTGFEMVYSAASGLTATVKQGMRTFGVFTVTAAKWQIGIFPLDEAQSDADATPPPAPKGDVVITGGACKGSPVPSASTASL